MAMMPMEYHTTAIDGDKNNVTNVATAYITAYGNDVYKDKQSNAKRIYLYFLLGANKSLSVNDVIFQLPTGYEPLVSQRLPLMGNKESGFVGTIQLTAGSRNITLNSAITNSTSSNQAYYAHDTYF